MKCDKAQARLVAFLLGEVSQWESNRIAAHVGNCPSCLEELDSLRLTVALLERLPDERLSVSFNERLVERLARLPAPRPSTRAGTRVPASVRGLRWAVVGVITVAWVGLLLTVPALRRWSMRPQGHIAPRQMVALPALGRIVQVRGEPRLQASHDKIWHVCRTEEPISGDSTLTTAGTDRAEVELRDGSRIRVDYDTELQLARATGPGRDVRPATLYLRSGRVWLLLTRSQAGMIVRTPTAKAEALGTIFSLAVEKGGQGDRERSAQAATRAGRTSIAVFRGKVKFSSQHGMITVGEGRYADVATGAPVTPPDAADRLRAIRLQVPWGRKGFIDWTPERLSWATALKQVAGRRAWLGVSLGPTPDSRGASSRSLSVIKVAVGSPAQKAGIRRGDRLTRMDELAIGGREDLARSELLFAPGERVRLLVERSGQSRQITATLAALGDSLSGDGATLERANRLFAANKVTAAKQAYDELIQKGEQKPAALHNLGVVYELADRMEAAVAAYGEAVDLSPKLPQYRFSLAMSLFRIGNLPRAADELEAALASDSAFADARFSLGKIRALSGERDAAIKQARFLQASPASSAQGYCLMGDIAMLRGDAKEGQRWYLRAAQADPSSPDFRIYLARGCFVQGKLKDAQRWAESALRLEAESPSALNGLGLILLRRGFTDRAERAFVEAAAQCPTSGAPYNNLGLLYQKKKDLRAARAAYEKAVALSPDSPACHLGLAHTLDKSGRFDAAKREYAMALRLDPSYELAYERLASLHERLGERQLAQDVLAKARQYGL